MSLKVFLYSTSLKLNDLPPASSEHGSGYVFDLRCLPNPGRNDEYKNLTGLDEPVVVYLDNLAEVKAYEAHVRALIDSTITNYITRNFEHVSVTFGCTGGQHRSVYFADNMYRYLSKKYPDVEVQVEHMQLKKKGLL